LHDDAKANGEQIVQMLDEVGAGYVDEDRRKYGISAPHRW